MESNNLLSTGEASFQASKIRGLTPPINGEKFDIKRSYQFRASTLKKLNQLKGDSDNINIYLNEIIDAAICFYYDSVFNQTLKRNKYQKSIKLLNSIEYRMFAYIFV